MKNEISETEISDKIVHYKKINIFSRPGVGKSSLILLLDNYDNSNFQIDDDSNQTNKNEDDKQNRLVEQIKKVMLTFAGGDLYLNMYETNILDMDYIIEHIETLISDSEGIIFMYDITSEQSFIIKQREDKYFPPMILLLKAQ